MHFSVRDFGCAPFYFFKELRYPTENKYQITIQKSKFNKIVYKVTKMCYNDFAT